jgi:hypothetical protein
VFDPITDLALLTRISHRDPGFWGDRGKPVERSFKKA